MPLKTLSNPTFPPLVKMISPPYVFTLTPESAHNLFQSFQKTELIPVTTYNEAKILLLFFSP
jgi:hypothetical protein